MSKRTDSPTALRRRAEALTWLLRTMRDQMVMAALRTELAEVNRALFAATGRGEVANEADKL